MGDTDRPDDARRREAVPPQPHAPTAPAEPQQPNSKFERNICGELQRRLAERIPR